MCMHRFFGRFWVIVLSLAMVLGPTGCRSLTNPHVRPKVTDRPNPGADLQAALLYADKVQQRYNKAIGNQARLTSWMGLTLIPLGAVGVFIGATSSSRGSKDALLGLTLAGAAGYGSGTWLSSKPRTLVYILGAEAVGCAKAAVQPFALSSDQRKELERAIYGDPGVERSLPDVLNDLPRQIVEVEKEALSNPAGSLSRFGRGYVKEAKSFQAEANAGLSQAYLLDKRLAAVGQRLLIALDRIMAQVDRAIVATLPDLSPLPGVIRGLRGQAQVFGEIKMKEPVLGGGTQGRADKLENALETLANTVAITEKKLAVIKSISDAIEQSRAATPLEECGVAIEAPSLRLSPSNRITVTSGEGFERRIAINGGQPLYFAELLDRVPGLTVSSASDSGAAFVLVKAESGKTVPAGTYRAIIYDTTGTARGQTLEIVVEPAVDSKEDSRQDPPTTEVKQLTVADIQRYQDALCVAQSDKLDDVTVKAIRILQRDVLGLPKDNIDGALGRSERQALEELGPCLERRTNNLVENVYESYLVMQSRVRELQQALQVESIDGTFNSDTREKIKAFKAENDIEPADGRMTKQVFGMLLPDEADN